MILLFCCAHYSVVVILFYTALTHTHTIHSFYFALFHCLTFQNSVLCQKKTYTTFVLFFCAFINLKSESVFYPPKNISYAKILQNRETHHTHRPTNAHILMCVYLKRTGRKKNVLWTVCSHLFNEKKISVMM